MKTLWDKGSKLNEAIATFTIWDDQTLDAKLARHDVLGSLAHIKTIEKAGVLTHQEMLALKKELIALYALAEAGELADRRRTYGVSGKCQTHSC